MPAVEALEQGRAYSAQSAWRAAHAALTSADADEPLGAADLELLATSAYMLGRDDEYLERARPRPPAPPRRRRAPAGRERGVLDRHAADRRRRDRPRDGLDRPRRAAPGARAGRVRRARSTCCCRGPSARRRAATTTRPPPSPREAAAVGERFGDRDLCALAAHLAGPLPRARRADRRRACGCSTRPWSRSPPASSRRSPTGIVYCGVILGCQPAHEPRRAREWTAALARWCERQPDMVAFSGRCHVHRAEIRQLEGAWSDALDEARAAARARRAGQPPPRRSARPPTSRARCTGCAASSRRAEEAYRDGQPHGREPQPGLALLRLAQGRRRRGVGRDPAGARRETDRRASRAACCRRAPRSCSPPATSTARARASDELASIAAGDEAACWGRWPTTPAARSSSPRATRKPRCPRCGARSASGTTSSAPYEAARARLLIGAACRALGDEDAACARARCRPRRVRVAGRHDGPGARSMRSPARSAAPRRGGLTARELRGAAPARGRPDEQGDRGRARPQRPDRRPSRQQHLRQAGRRVARRRDRLRLRARAGWVKAPTSRGAARLGGSSDAQPRGAAVRSRP